MKWTDPPTPQHAAACTCTLAQRRMSSQLTKHNDNYPIKRFFFPASAPERSRGDISAIDVPTIGCFCLASEPASILYERRRITTLYRFTAAAQWGMFQGPFQECLLKATCTHRKKGKRGETFVLSDSALKHSLWLPTQFVLFQARFCHNDDLKCAPSAPSTSCNGQWDFDSRAVIGFHLGIVFYSPVSHMYSLRTWLLIACAGMAGQQRRYPLETPALFWHRLSVRNGLRSQALH